MRSLFDAPAKMKESENVAGRQGVEPRLTGSEPAVLPLNDLPVLERGRYASPDERERQ